MVGRMSQQFFRIAGRDHRAAFRVEKDAVICDCENARQLVRHHHHGGAQVVAQLENQIVEQPRAYRIESGRRLVEKKNLGVECDRAREPRPLLHPAADLARVVILETAQPDQRQLKRGDFPNLVWIQIRELAQRQTDVLRERHRTPKRAALIEYAETPQPGLALFRLSFGEIEFAVQHFAFGRLDQSNHVPQQRAFAASAAAHDHEDVVRVDFEIQIVHHDEGAERHRQVAHRDGRRLRVVARHGRGRLIRRGSFRHRLIRRVGARVSLKMNSAQMPRTLKRNAKIPQATVIYTILVTTAVVAASPTADELLPH